VKDVRDALMVGRTSDGKLVGRPLSPHLQVYKWPVSMALSIGHRVSGVGISIGTLLLTWWLVAAAVGDHAFSVVQGFLASGFGVFLLVCWTGALLFHLCTGIRHLFWDAGIGFDNRIYRTTGWGAIGATAVLTLIVWIVGFVVW
jgi:succinate dehydrogenase / fumarate reductase cytochrome b subunit